MFGMEGYISKAEFSERAGAIKLRVQMAVVAVGALLMCAKFAAFLFTNSAAILTDAMESIVNVAAGLVSLYGIRLASRPKDSDHPFGHGKIELVSASVEGLLILAAGVAIVCEGAARLISPAEIERLDMGLAVVALAGAANFLMGSVSIHFGRKYGSMALIAGGMESPTGVMKEDWSLAAHFLSEVYEQREDPAAFIEGLKDGSVSLIDDAKFNEMMDTFDILKDNNYAKDAAISAEREVTEQKLAEGEIAFMFGGNWDWSVLSAYDYTENMGIMPVPNDSNDGSNEKLVGGGSKYFFIDSSEQTSDAQRQAAPAGLYGPDLL